MLIADLNDTVAAITTNLESLLSCNSGTNLTYKSDVTC